jgi:hypothetical protein
MLFSNINNEFMLTNKSRLICWPLSYAASWNSDMVTLTRFKAVTAMTMKTVVVRNVTPCSLASVLPSIVNEVNYLPSRWTQHETAENSAHSNWEK